MFKGLVDKAKSFKDKVHTVQPSEVGFSSTDIDAGRSKVGEAFEAQWLKVETLVIEHALPLASDSLKDEEGMRTLFDTAFGMLPIHVRLILPKAMFLEMAMNRRAPLLSRIEELRGQAKS